MNVVLGIFNLLPVPPLDGSRIVAAFLNDGDYARWRRSTQYGMFALFGVIILFNEEFTDADGRRTATHDRRDRRLVGGVRLLPWEAAPAGYRVVFSTRLGGVSDGPFRSLNLGLLTDDEPESVVENRTAALRGGRADPRATATMALPGARRARDGGASRLGVVTPGTRVSERCDGLWTDRAGSARCCSSRRTACRSRSRGRTGRAPSPSSMPAGAASSAGIAQSGFEAIADGRRTGRRRDRARDRAVLLRGRGGGRRRRSGPASATTSCATVEARSPAGAAEHALREAGVDDVERSRHCTACEPELFFSHRRDRGLTGRQGYRRCYRLTRFRENLARVREEVGPGVHVVVATKYVIARRAGARWPRPASSRWARTGSRTSRRSTSATRDAFRWHFIGHLQSRKAPRVSELVRARPLARLALGRAAARAFPRSSR